MRVRVSSNERKLDTASKPVNTPNMGVRRISVSGLARYARSFYELLGNRRKFERTPMSGTVFVTCKGSVADTTQVASCVDISPRGMAVDCSELLTKDQVVQLHSEDLTRCSVRGPPTQLREQKLGRMAWVLGIDTDGQVVHNLQDPAGRFGPVTSVIEVNGRLYFGSIGTAAIGWVPTP